MSRFDHVSFDAQAQKKREDLKEAFSKVEHAAETHLPNGRYKALLLTALEEAYAWAGKAIRDDQIARNGSAPLQEARTNS